MTDGNKQSPIKLLMLTRRIKSTNSQGELLVSPEELLTELVCKLMAPKVTLEVSACDETLLEECDHLVGQWPILVYQHWFVPRRYIWQFLCHQLCDFDDAQALTEAEKEQVHAVSRLV